MILCKGLVVFFFLSRPRARGRPKGPGRRNFARRTNANPTPTPRQPNAVPTKSLLGSLPAAGAADLTRKPVLNPWRGADRRPHTFPEASGVHFGTNFGFKNDHFCHLFGGPVGAFFGPVFRRFFATQALYNLIASAFARKSRIRLATHKNQRIFPFLLFARRRKARSKARNRGQKWYRKRHPKCI